ncbi:unnamed protein product [Symbiodinium necroappetens]|uniref:Secreted protein n=1 Tax=Symbiodinium necroappetens TaxID=1628268 RepID=A0A813CC66_9DINO|nr:unnamed protein product [Symbiodinium necroappetens]
MACAAAAVHKKKPQSRLLALLALSWACLQTAQPVRALAGPTVRAALFDPRTPAFWLSRLRFLAVCAVLCRLSVRLQKSHSTPHGTPLHSTPGHSPTPPRHGVCVISCAFFWRDRPRNATTK